MTCLHFYGNLHVPLLMLIYRLLLLTYIEKKIEVPVCPVLSDPDNGKVFVFDKSAVYTCNTGYTLVGTPFLQCISGIWIGQPPTCVLP